MEIKSFNSNFYMNHKSYSLVNKKNVATTKIMPKITKTNISGNNPPKINQTNIKEDLPNE